MALSDTFKRVISIPGAGMMSALLTALRENLAGQERLLQLLISRSERLWRDRAQGKAHTCAYGMCATFRILISRKTIAI